MHCARIGSECLLVFLAAGDIICQPIFALSCTRPRNLLPLTFSFTFRPLLPLSHHLLITCDARATAQRGLGVAASKDSRAQRVSPPTIRPTIRPEVGSSVQLPPPPPQSISNQSSSYSPQLYELSNDPKRKEFLDDLFSFMQKRGESVCSAFDRFSVSDICYFGNAGPPSIRQIEIWAKGVRGWGLVGH